MWQRRRTWMICRSVRKGVIPVDETLLREYYCTKLYGEFQEFKASILSLSNSEIFDRCFEIDTMTNFYEILVEKSEKLSGQELLRMLRCRNILTEIYHRWMKKDDDVYDELTAFVADEIKGITREKGGDEQ